MDIKYTKTTLQKIEQLFKEAGYTVRYEKGQFHSGFCVLELRKVVVVNRFLDMEGRINVLIDIFSSLDVSETELSEEALKTYRLLSAITAGSDEDQSNQLEIDFEK